MNQQRLKELVRYDPLTGDFQWIQGNARAKRGSKAGHIKDNGYLHFSVDGKKHGAHRLAWLYMTGAFPLEDIDHINGDRSDNRFSNLRAVSRSVNLQNNRLTSRKNKTGLLGAYPVGNRFMSRIRVFGKDIYLGCFATAEEAHQCYITTKRGLHEGCTI